MDFRTAHLAYSIASAGLGIIYLFSTFAVGDVLTRLASNFGPIRDSEIAAGIVYVGPPIVALGIAVISFFLSNDRGATGTKRTKNTKIEI